MLYFCCTYAVPILYLCYTYAILLLYLRYDVYVAIPKENSNKRDAVHREKGGYERAEIFPQA